MHGAGGAATGGQRRAVQALDAEEAQAGDGAGDVDDGVERADLVELDGVGGNAVDARLRLGEAAEDREDGCLVGQRERRGLDDGGDVGQAAVRLARLGEVDVGERRGDPGAAHALGAQRPAVDAEPPQFGGEGIGIDAGVDEGAEQHVAADAGEAVEIGDRGHAIRVADGGSRPVGASSPGRAPTPPRCYGVRTKESRKASKTG